MIRRRIFDEVFSLEVAISAVVFVLVLAAVLFAVVRRRARHGVTPSQRTERYRLEGVFLGGLAVIAVFLVGYTASANHRDDHAEDDRPPVTVDLTAFQWCWKFSQRVDGHAGEPARRTETTTADCRRGHKPTLVVPTGRTVRFEMKSEDVIHSLWVPALRYKMDIFPDHRNTFTVKIDKEGRWIARCAEFCGELHHAMDFWLKAVPPEEYDAWLQDHAAPTGTAAA